MSKSSLSDSLTQASLDGYKAEQLAAKNTMTAMCGVAANLISTETDHKITNVAFAGGEYPMTFDANGPYQVNPARGYYNEIFNTNGGR